MKRAGEIALCEEFRNGASFPPGLPLFKKPIQSTALKITQVNQPKIKINSHKKVEVHFIKKD